METAELSSTVSVVIRRARLDESDAIGFFVDCVLRRDYYIRRAQLEEILSGKRHETFVALEGNWIVAFAILTRGSRLVNILVHPSYRGVGLGQAMIEASEAKSVRVKLDMVSGDPTEFYKRVGFRTSHAKSGVEHIVIMER
jgi:GNAT superfamily N-acetyltransferase